MRPKGSCLHPKLRTISTHTPHTGCDTHSISVAHIKQNFNSHTPHGVRQYEFDIVMNIGNFNSHTPHGVRLFSRFNSSRISALFQLTHPTRGATAAISPPTRNTLFQLTHPTRGATERRYHHPQEIHYFNSHTPHGVRRAAPTYCLAHSYFNSHTPHGVRLCRANCTADIAAFQLTHPTRGATPFGFGRGGFYLISTHTPHTGCDRARQGA